MTSFESQSKPDADPRFTIEPYGDHNSLVTSLETGARNVIPNKPLDIPDPSVTEQGKYTESERDHFNDVLGPGAAVALESLRMQAGIRLKVTKHASRKG